MFLEAILPVFLLGTFASAFPPVVGDPTGNAIYTPSVNQVGTYHLPTHSLLSYNGISRCPNANPLKSSGMPLRQARLRCCCSMARAQMPCKCIP